MENIHPKPAILGRIFGRTGTQFNQQLGSLQLGHRIPVSILSLTDYENGKRRMAPQLGYLKNKTLKWHKDSAELRRYITTTENVSALMFWIYYC